MEIVDIFPCFFCLNVLLVCFYKVVWLKFKISHIGINISLHFFVYFILFNIFVLSFREPIITPDTKV